MKSRLYKVVLGLAVAGVLCAPLDGSAQKKKKKDEAPAPAAAAPAPEKDKGKSIADIVKGSRSIPGLFQMYQDTVSGAVRMVVKEDQLNKDFILFSHVMNGVTDAGYFKGSYRGSTIFSIRKYFDKIEFVEENTRFYFDPSNAISRSADANVSRSIMLSEKIEATDKGERRYLIKCDALFLKETLGQVKPARSPNTPPTAFSLGNLDANKSKVVSIKNYPENSDVLVEFVYTQDAPLNGGSGAVTDARNVSIQILQSFIKVPENDYKPRNDDPRVGFFNVEMNDMTGTDAIPFHDYINRWHLKKKDPSAAVSEPVEPITWWIENTTPVQFRDVIRDAVLRWNIAFEKAGFKNAVVVKVQPDDATWDAGDIRYNVLRWTSSPNPPFGGYGPSFVNPRTGQILGADVMLEYVFFTNTVAAKKLYDFSSFGIGASEEEQPLDPTKYCSFGYLMQENNLFGEAVMLADGAADSDVDGLKKEAMYYLIMHEVGHTLGLNHNMKASQLWSPDQLYNKDMINGKALAGSVMDYPALNVTPDRAKQGHYHTTTLGPYDEWAIEFGYRDFTSQAQIDELLAKSTRPELIFGNDADDMRAPGKAIDPRVNTGDMSNDQIRYSIDRINLVNDMLKKVKDRYTKTGQSYQELRQSYFVLTGQYSGAANTISRFIGGVYVDRGMAGQAGATKPFTPVSYADQKKAMGALNKYVFAPDAFKAPNELYNYLAMQRRGFNFFAAPEDPKIHDRVLAFQRGILAHILHPNTLQRIVDSQLYGNTYSLSEFMTELNSGIFGADLAGNVNSFRQNLQVEYVKNLIAIATSRDYMNTAKSMAVYLLRDNRAKLAATGDLSTKAHREHLRTLIANALEEVK